MHALLEELEALFPELTPKLKIAAKFVLDRPNMVATSSMRELARSAGVTAPTYVRLAQSLGFDNYQAFRDVFRKSVDGYDFKQRADRLQRTSRVDGVDSIVERLSNASQNNMVGFYQQLDIDDITRAADLIINAKMTYVVAAGAPHWIAAYLQYVGKMAVPNLRVPRTSGESLIEGVIPIREGEVLLAMTYHPYSQSTIEAVEYGLSRGALLIYFTDSVTAPLVAQASVVIRQQTESPQFFPSMVGVTTAIETLLAVIVARSDPSAIDAISTYATIRQQRYVSI